MEKAENQRARRRPSEDPILSAIPWVGGIGWLLMVAALFLAATAQPESETLIERWHQKEVNLEWNLQRLHWVFRLCIASLAASLIGLACNSRRLKRKKDELRINLLLLGALSLAGMVFYFWMIMG